MWSANLGRVFRKHGGSFHGRRAKAPARRHRLEISLARLECRTLLTVIDVAAGDVSGLIAAINTANADPPGDTITLAANSTYDLTAVNNTTGGANGLPVITAKGLTIEGDAHHHCTKHQRWHSRLSTARTGVDRRCERAKSDVHRRASEGQRR